MRTALVAHPSPDLYGSDRMLLESIDGLLEAGWRVVVTLPATGPLVAELDARDVQVEVVPVPVLRKNLLSPRGAAGFAAACLRALPGMLRLLRRVRPDAVYVNTVTVPLWFAAARLAGRRVLGHVHEAEEGVPRPVRMALASPLLLASTVAVNSRASAGALDSLPRLRRRVRVVYNGVAGPDRELPVREDAPRPARLVVVGRLSPRKGTDVAVDAVRLLRADGRDVTLDLVGSIFPGYEWFEDQLREQAAPLGDAVRFRGFLPSVWTAYEEADVALVPSRVEPFGNTAVEGQLAGRPVVVSRTQGLVEIVEDGRTGRVVAPGDAAELAAAVGALLDDWPGARKLAEVGREEAVRRFDPARYRAEIAAAVAALVR